MGKEKEARDFIRKNRFITVLNLKFEAHHDILSIIQPFFERNWTEGRLVFGEPGGLWLASIAAVALRRIKALDGALATSVAALEVTLRYKNWNRLCFQILSIASTVGEINHLALEDRLIGLIIKWQEDPDVRFVSEKSLQLTRLRQLARLGKFTEAKEVWNNINLVNADQGFRAIALHHYTLMLFLEGTLSEEELGKAEAGNHGVSAIGMRNLWGLRGSWHLEKREWKSAKKALQQAVLLAHRAGKVDRRSELRLALVQHELQQLSDARQMIEHLERDAEGDCYESLAALSLAIGLKEQAGLFARAAYKWAWADGEPFVRRYQLRKAKEILYSIGESPPELPDYDKECDIDFPWVGSAAKEIDRLLIEYRNSFSTRVARPIRSRLWTKDV